MQNKSNVLLNYAHRVGGNVFLFCGTLATTTSCKKTHKKK